MIYIGLCTASIALFTDFEIVVQMISIGTLVVFYLVANALIYRRYVIIGNYHSSQILLFLFLLSLSAIGFSFSWKYEHYWWGLLLFGGSTLTIIALFQYLTVVPCLDQAHPSTGWSVPYMPWPPALSIFLNVFLMTTLKKLSFQRFGIWTVLITLFYILYGVHQTYQAEESTQMIRVDHDHDHDRDQVNFNSSVQQTKLDNIQVMSVISQV